MLGQLPSVATSKLLGCDVIDTGFAGGLANRVKSRVHGGRGSSKVTIHVSDFTTMHIDKVTIKGTLEIVRSGKPKK